MVRSVVKELLVWLARRGQHELLEVLGSEGKKAELYGAVYNKLTNPVKVEKLEKLDLTARYSSNEEREFLFMPTFDDGGLTLPVASLLIDLQDEKAPEIRFKVAFFSFNAEEELAAIGIRFETPDGEPGDNHAHYHAQLFSAFSKNEKPLPCCPTWLPESLPAIGLRADDPITLALTVILSIYGYTITSELRTSLRNYKELKGCVGETVRYLPVGLR